MGLEEGLVEQRALSMSLEPGLKWEDNRPEQGPLLIQYFHFPSLPTRAL